MKNKNKSKKDKSRKDQSKKRKSKKDKDKKKRQSKKQESKRDKDKKRNSKKDKSKTVTFGSAKKTRRKDAQAFTPQDLEFYQRVIERNQQMMLDHEDVVAFGVGYGRKQGKWTDEISLVVEVNEKSASVTEKRRIPKIIDGLSTDVVEFEKPVFDDPVSSRELLVADECFHEWTSPPILQSIPTPPPPPPPPPLRPDLEEISSNIETRPSNAPKPHVDGRNKNWRKLGLPRLENIEFNPLLGGIAIRNPDIGKVNACVLGAIVYDAEGVAHGLSVEHGIGDKANLNAPIHQPMDPNPKYKIGTLVKVDADLDAALFRIDTDRVVEARVKGEDDDFEPGEPLEPIIGMAVECFGRRNHAKGKVTSVRFFYSPIHQKPMRKVHIRVEKGYVTQGGDSGSVWFETKSKRPIGLHLGSERGDQTHDIATCMVDLAKAWGFRFSPPQKSKLLEAELKNYETCFVKRDDGLVALCQRAGEQIRFKHFDHDCKKTNDSTGLIFPKSGLAAAELKSNTNGEPNFTFVFWRTRNDHIHYGKLDSSNNKLIDVPKHPLGLRTFHKPAAASFKKQVVFAFTDSSSGKITIVRSSDGKQWFYFLKSNQTSIAAPALTEFNGKLFISWVAPGNSQSVISNSFGQVKISELKPHKKSLKFGAIKNVTQHNSSKLDPALCAGDDCLFLAYTNASNQVEILKGKDVTSLKPHDKVDSISAASPSLFFAEGELICSRRENVYPPSNVVWW